jgi:pyruvate,water dikinase
MVDKVAMELIKKSIGQKKIGYKMNQNAGKVICEDIAPDKQCIPCLTDEEVLELARLAKIIERHFGEPQDIEWAIDDDELLPTSAIILQTRPETVWSKRKKRKPVFEPKANVLNIMVDELKKGH